VRKFLMAATALVIAAPALAQQGAPANEEYTPVAPTAAPAQRTQPVDPRDEEVVRNLPRQQDVERIGDVVDATVGAVLQVPVGPIKEAIEGRKLSRREREETLGDVASKDDPYFRERMRDQIAVAGVAMEVLAEQMAVMTPIFRRTLEDVERRVEDAARGLPPRDYDRRDRD